MDILESMVGELRGAIEDVAMGMDQKRFVMLSHDDLDGIGCTILTGHVIETLGGKTLNNGDSIYKRHSIFAHNTNKMSPDLYEVLDTMLFSASTSVDHHQIVVLITDLGNITFEELYKRYRQYNIGHITFIIVDHHKHPYALVPDAPYTTENVGEKRLRHYQLDHVAETGSTIAYMDDGPFFRAYLWSECEHMCATLMLAELYESGSICQLSPNVMEWARIINRWDTGNAGNWYIPLAVSGIPTDTDGYKSLAPEIKMYYTWNLPNMITNLDRSTHLHDMITNMIRQLNCDNDFNVDVHEPEIVSTVARDVSREYRRFVDILHQSRVKVIDKMENGDLVVSVNNNDFQFTIPACVADTLPVDQDMVLRNVKAFVRDNSTNLWSITLFAKRLFEIESDATDGVKLLVGITKNNNNIPGAVRAELRSTPDVSSYEIAKTNGGGGHTCAAGFIKKPQ